MQFLKDTAFVIKRVNVGEADKFITLYSQNNGKVEVLAKGVRKIKSRRASSIELLNLVCFQSVRTRKNFILTEVEVLNTFEHIKNDYTQMQIVFLMCELINALCAAGQVNDDVFHLMKNTLERINQDSAGQETFDFQVKLLENLGFLDNRKQPIQNDHQLRSYIESIIEKKVKTKLYFEN